jgi:predicted aldo/keto reductase-like oxidoreductase
MNYRQLGKLGLQVSALGFGAMRLPTIGGKDSDVDEAAAIEMIRYAIDHGVNYIDTAYPYHGGSSEVAVGKALADGYRERVLLATKLPIWNVHSLADCDRFLDEQLARLQTDHVDVYLLHCLQQRWWPKMQELGVLAWAERVRGDGRIRHFGFSFHDTFEVFRRIVDAYDWSLCQIQYNIVNEDVQAGSRGLQYAVQRGLAVIVMEPLFGGTLASPPESVRRIWQSGPQPQRPVDLSLRWLWDRPEVSLVLSGMSTLEQVQENVEIAGRSGVGSLSNEERRLIRRVQQKYEKLSPVPCTKCGYCMPCPHGVDIPRNFELHNQAFVFGGSSVGLCRNLYLGLSESERARACEQCGTCEEACPQKIKISQRLPEVAEAFETAANAEQNG